LSSTLDISVIIVNYKGWAYLKDCLSGLFDITESTFTFEIIVVDNCSNDGKLKQFITNYKSVIFFKNTGNNGFANACNLGAKKAKGEFLLFLNPDTIANADALTKMLETVKNNLDIGAISCVQINQKEQLYNYKKLFLSPKTLFGFLRIFYRFFNKKGLQKRFSSPDKIFYPDWISGSVILISRLRFKKIGAFNEAYWMYYEDADLCRRLTDNGLKIAVLQNVRIKHYHGGSSRINYNVKAITKSEVIKSRHIYIRLHFKGITRFLMQSAIVFYQLTNKLIFGMIGIIFFFIKPASLYRKLFKEVYLYYFRFPAKHQWLSSRSIKFKT